MIEMNVRRMCRERGIPHPVSALMKAGIGQGIVSKYLEGKAQRVPLAHLEKLCLLFRCTPNELFTWTPAQKADDYPENPLQAIRHKPSFDLEEKLKGMSLDEIKRRLGEICNFNKRKGNLSFTSRWRI